MIPPLKDFDFYTVSKLYIKISYIKNLIFLLLFHGLSFDILEKRKKVIGVGGGGGHQTHYLSGGQNLTPSIQISSIIQYKTIKGCNFCYLVYNSIIYINIYNIIIVALRPKSTAMVTAGRSVHLTTLFPG